MTDEQQNWLAENPRYSVVRPRLVSLTNWTAQGYLFPTGRFVEDDGKTLFWYPKGAMRVGREYQVV